MDQCNIEIFSSLLRLLPLCSSTFHQTIVEIALNRAKNHTKSSCMSHWRSLCTVIEISSQTDSGLWETVVSKKFFLSLFVCGSGAGKDERVLIVAETTSVSFCALPCCFPRIAIPFLPFNAGRFPFTSFHQYSCFTSFASGLKDSGSDLLIHASPYHGLQSLIAGQY